MASPQRENGYTAIANELLEEIIKARLPGNQLAVVLLVLRESYGWSRKHTMPMGYKTMSKKTGIPRASIQLALSVLVEARILTVKEGRWKLNKDYQDWLNGGQPTGPGGASPLAPKGASPLAPGGQPTGYSKAIDESNREKQKTVALSAPRRTPLQEIVELYKFLKRIGYIRTAASWEPVKEVHRAWDKDNFKVYLRSAKKLLTAFGGNLDAAQVFLAAKADEWTEAGLDWELHGVAKHAVNFAAKEKTKDAQANGAGALEARRDVAGELGGGPLGPGGGGREQRGPSGLAPARNLAGKVLERLEQEIGKDGPVR